MQNANKFPLLYLPGKMQSYVMEAHESLRFPVDYMAASMLFAAAVGFGNTHHLEVKPGWVERAIMYMVLVGPPSANKSHPLSMALKWQMERDGANFAKFLKDMDVKDDDAPKPVWNRVLIQDATPEAVRDILYKQQRGIAVNQDELAGWFKNFNRYNSGSDQEFWLSVWSGKPITVDRKSGLPLHIRLPFIGVIGTIQTAILHELAKESRGNNGFVDRMLFVLLESQSKPLWSDILMDDEVSEAWGNALKRLMDLPQEVDANGAPQPRVLKYSKAARDVVYEWQAQNVKTVEDESDERLQMIYGKLEIHIHRLALILEMCHWACETNAALPEFISERSARGAAAFMEYFRVNATRVNTIIHSSNPLDKFPLDVQSWYSFLPEEFATADAVTLAEKFNITERRAKRFLAKEDKLFQRLGHGKYARRR